MVRRARGKVADLLLLVSDLMTLSRVKEGLEPTKRVLVDVKAVLARILEDEKVNADEKGITLSAELPRHIPPLYCTHENVDSLFRNLIHNAVRYTPEGGSVGLTVRIDGAAIHAEVSDTGIGIPADDLENVFTEFYRSPEAKRHAKGGTGLGLSIVKRVVDTLGGDIHVQSEVGTGTTFRVQLPGYGSGD
jgi:signal transduction histidine kinase